MILSEERQTHWAHVVTDKVWGDDIVDFSDDDQALRIAKKAIVEFVKEDMEIDKSARDKVASLKRGVIEGTREWEILYKKYYEEEKNRYGK
jgi:uncharacterized protein